MRLPLRLTRLLLGTLALAVGALAPAGADADTWRLVNEPGFGNPDNSVSAMAVFDGHLYVATDNDSTGSEIWKSRLGSWQWRQVTPLWNAGTTRARAMVVFDGRLYVGTEQGEVWRTAGEITLSPCQRFPFQPGGCLKRLDAPLVLELWSEATPTSTSWRGSEVTSLAVFSGRIFLTASAPLEVWRSADGLAWNAVVRDAFDDPQNNHSGKLLAFDDHLYVATSRNLVGGTGPSDDGLEIWRSPTGFFDWSAVVATGEPEALLPSGFGFPGNGGAMALTVFQGRLYVSTVNHTDGAQIWRFDGSAWEEVTPAQFEPVIRIQTLGVFGRRIFAGQGFTSNDTLLWRSGTGDTWTLDTGEDFASTPDVAIEAMAASRSHFYLGTRGRGDPAGGRIWQKQPSLADQGPRAPTPCLIPKLCLPPFPPVLTPGD
jgi:hypothetical protein